MAWLLNAVYLTLILILSPWLLYCAWRKGKYREGWSAKFWGRVPRRSGSQPCVWLHAVSVGEVNLLRPLLGQLERRYPNHEFVISTTTKAGYDLARRHYAPRAVFYCPLDFSWAVAEALDRIRPQVLVLAELEIWPNLIRAAQRRGVSVAIINGRLSERSLRGYLRLGNWFASLLQRIKVIAAQNSQYAARFRLLGANPETVHDTGSIKFDGVETDRQHPEVRRLRQLAGVAPEDLVFLAGSTQDPEERLAVETYRDLVATIPQLRLIIVPRHPERFAEVAQQLQASGLAWQRRSLIEAEGANSAARILLVDSVGELRYWWGVADVGFVGGSLGNRGGQSMIEPAGFGVATSFGPNTWNFRETVDMLVRAEAAVVVNDGRELSDFVRKAVTDRAWSQSLGERARRLVLEQAGAVERTVECLAPLLASGKGQTGSRTNSPIPAPHIARYLRHTKEETGHNGSPR